MNATGIGPISGTERPVTRALGQQCPVSWLCPTAPVLKVGETAVVHMNTPTPEPGSHWTYRTREEVITMASDDDVLAFAEEIDPELAKILADIRDYCEIMPPEEALDLIDKCRMVVSVCRDLGRLDGGAVEH